MRNDRERVCFLFITPRWEKIVYFSSITNGENSSLEWHSGRESDSKVTFTFSLPRLVKEIFNRRSTETHRQNKEAILPRLALCGQRQFFRREIDIQWRNTRLIIFHFKEICSALRHVSHRQCVRRRRREVFTNANLMKSI